MPSYCKIEDMLGQIFISVVNNKSEEILFTNKKREVFRMYHNQDCCEGVSVEDVIGDLNDLVGSPILMAEEATNSNDHPEGLDRQDESFTWTFYKFATIKGYVTIRWYGSSNGYYGEGVDLEKVYLKLKDCKDTIAWMGNLLPSQIDELNEILQKNDGDYQFDDTPEGIIKDWIEEHGGDRDYFYPLSVEYDSIKKDIEKIKNKARLSCKYGLFAKIYEEQ